MAGEEEERRIGAAGALAEAPDPRFQSQPVGIDQRFRLEAEAIEHQAEVPRIVRRVGECGHVAIGADADDQSNAALLLPEGGGGCEKQSEDEQDEPALGSPATPQSRQHIAEPHGATPARNFSARIAFRQPSRNMRGSDPLGRQDRRLSCNSAIRSIISRCSASSSCRGPIGRNAR